MKKSLQTVCAEVAALAQFTQQQEYQINSTLKQETVVCIFVCIILKQLCKYQYVKMCILLQRTSPIMERAQLVKKQLEETKTLTLKLENKEADLREIKKLLKVSVCLFKYLLYVLLSVYLIYSVVLFNRQNKMKYLKCRYVRSWPKRN